jgi:Phage gp6-like head-tail connector protein
MNGYRITKLVTPAASLALVTLDQVKGMLGIDLTDTSQDALLTQHIAAVSAAINNYCDRIFVVQTYRDQLRNVCGWFGQPIVTRQYPITVVSDVPTVTITESGVALDPAAFEVFAEAGELYRLDGSANPNAWTDPLTVIDYTAGFNPVPDPVQNAALEWITVRFYQTGNDPTVLSETIPDVITQSFAQDPTVGAMPDGPKEMLWPYRVWSM